MTTKPPSHSLERMAEEGLRFVKQMIIWDSDEEVCWDGFVPVFPGDPRHPDALARGLRSAGYRFREGPLEE